MNTVPAATGVTTDAINSFRAGRTPTTLRTSSIATPVGITDAAAPSAKELLVAAAKLPQATGVTRDAVPRIQEPVMAYIDDLKSQHAIAVAEQIALDTLYKACGAALVNLSRNSTVKIVLVRQRSGQSGDYLITTNDKDSGVTTYVSVDLNTLAAELGI